MDPKLSFGLFLLMLGTVSCAINLVPSKYLLQPGDSSVDFTCTGLKFEEHTEVAFRMNGMTVFNSSNPSQTADGVEPKSNTTIAYMNVTSGAENVSCLMNKIESSKLTVPYLGALTYKPDPKLFSVNKTFTGTCGNVQFTPNVTSDYHVSFWVNGSSKSNSNKSEVARWTVNLAKASFDPKPLPSLEVAEGTAHSPSFSANFTPTSKDAKGTYYCTVTYNNQESKQSQFWNTNATFGLVSPSLATILLATLMALIRM